MDPIGLILVASTLFWRAVIIEVFHFGVIVRFLVCDCFGNCRYGRSGEAQLSNVPRQAIEMINANLALTNK